MSNTADFQPHDEKLKGDRAKPNGKRRLLVSSKEFVSGFVPPDYLVDGILQRRFCYSMTGPTGGGKSAIALLLSAQAARGLSFGDHEVAKARVLYLAGENPDDIRMRWIAMADAIGFDLGLIDVHFVEGPMPLAKIVAVATREAQELGGVDLVNVDTSAAYFDGDNENDNVQMLKHARALRELTKLPGGPTVLAACHPTKNAGPDNLLPRGGGAFLNEMDGNLTCRKSDSIVDLHWQGKFRGCDFEPISFQLSTVTSDQLKDSKGRHIPTVMAKPLSEKPRTDLEASARRDEDALLVLMLQAPGGSMASMAEALGWLSAKSKPQKSRVFRGLEKLKTSKLVHSVRGSWVLTDAGRKEAKGLA